MSDTQATPLEPETHDQADSVELEASTSSGSGIEATVETAPADGGAPAAGQGAAETSSRPDGGEDRVPEQAAIVRLGPVADRKGRLSDHLAPRSVE